MQKRFVVFLAILAIHLPVTTFAEVKLTVWTTEIDRGRVQTITYLMNVFSAFYEGIEVELENIDENRILQQFEQLKHSKKRPDVLVAPSHMMAYLNNQRELDVTTTTKVIREFGLKRFTPGILDIARTKKKGSYHSIPFHAWIQGLWYRKDWFEKEQLPTPDSWQNILKAAKYFHQPQNGRYGILIGTASDAYTSQVFEHFAGSNGAMQYDKEGKLNFRSKEFIETLKFYKELSSFGPPGSNNWRARDYYLQGKLAMMFYSTFIMDDLALKAVAADSLTGNNFRGLSGTEFDPGLLNVTDVVSIIHKQKKAGFAAVQSLGLLTGSNAQRKEAVKSLAQFLLDRNSYIVWLHMMPGGMLPTIPEIAEEPLFYLDSKGVFQRYSRSTINAIMSGLSFVGTDQVRGGVDIGARHTIFSEIIHQAINKMVKENLSAASTSQWAHDQLANWSY